jgi:hypothetical protein
LAGQPDGLLELPSAGELSSTRRTAKRRRRSRGLAGDRREELSKGPRIAGRLRRLVLRGRRLCVGGGDKTALIAGIENVAAPAADYGATVVSAVAVAAAVYVFRAYDPKYGPNMYFVNFPAVYLKLFTELSEPVPALGLKFTNQGPPEEPPVMLQFRPKSLVPPHVSAMSFPAQ